VSFEAVQPADYLEAARIALYLGPKLVRAGILRAPTDSALCSVHGSCNVSQTYDRRDIESRQHFCQTCCNGCYRSVRQPLRPGCARFDGRFMVEPKVRRWRGPFGPGEEDIREEFLQQWRNQLETWSR
jgi:hypothetical protein